MTKGGNSDIIKHEIEQELRKYVSEQLLNDIHYIEKTVSIDADDGFYNDSLNELIAEVLLQEDKGTVKDKNLLKLVRGCVE